MVDKPAKGDNDDKPAGASGKPAAGEKPGADAAGPAPGSAREPTKAPSGMAITVNAQYTKDLSFEVPAAPGIYAQLRDTQPDITVNINVTANPVQDNTFEVVLETRADCKVKGQVAFILELQYAGVFTLSVPQEHLQPILLIECPRLLFPFARNILADVSRDGGFPPVFLGIVDFAQMYQAKLQELQQSGGAGNAPSGGGATA